MPPLKRDHSRSQDVNDKIGFIQNVSSSTAYAFRNKQIPQIIEDYNSDEDSIKSKIDKDHNIEDNEKLSPE